MTSTLSSQLDDHYDPNSQNPSLDSALNMAHMELLIHFSTEWMIPNLSLDLHAPCTSIVLKAGLGSPYFLHEILAYSAHHLAFLNPNQSHMYRNQSIALQTRAVSLFNATLASGAQVNESNCVAMLLFSTALAHHLLVDTLEKRPVLHTGNKDAALDEFLVRYAHCVGMQKGVRAVAISAWPLLLESEIKPFITWSLGLADKPARGDHTNRLRSLLDSTEALGEEGRRACVAAAHLLQFGFDAILAPCEQGLNWYEILFSWSVLTPREFDELVAARKPEALVVLAYYAALLCYGRKAWQIGDAGAYLLGIIVEALGPGWNEWLDIPRKMIAEDLR